jgi:formate dehydrogenase major subunit
MDPRGQALSRHADYMLRFKPGTDVALLNAMLNVIIEEGLADEPYIQGMTEGYEDLKRKVKDFPPEKMAPVCGIDADTIRAVARVYAKAVRGQVCTRYAARTTSKAPRTSA